MTPPLVLETANAVVHLSEDIWNSKDPIKTSLLYSIDSKWRDCSHFIEGREAIQNFLQKKWTNELDFKIKKELFAFIDYKLAISFQYEFRSLENPKQWLRVYGNEHLFFNDEGLIIKRDCSTNTIQIEENERVL